MSNWKRASSLSEIPCAPGCYAILVDNAWLYVGSTSNLNSRIRQHNLRRKSQVPCIVKLPADCDWMTPWGAAKSVHIRYRTCKRYGERLMVEARLIKRLQPPLNVKGRVNGKKQTIWQSYEYSGFVKPVAEVVEQGTIERRFD